MRLTVKPKKKTTAKPKDHQKKVFDVSRPGKSMAAATSRPVIVGHKPQIKDPMMSDRDEQRPLLDSKQKVAVLPSENSAEQSEKPQTTTPELAAVSADTQTPAGQGQSPEAASDTVATVALSDMVEAPKAAPEPATPAFEVPVAPEQAVVPTPTEMAVSEVPTEPVKTENPISPPVTTTQVSQAAPTSPIPQTKSTGIIFEDDSSDLLAAPTKSPQSTAASAPASPKSDLDSVAQSAPIPPEEMPKAQVFVAHHSRSGGWKIFTILFLFLILLAIGLDIALDMGLLSLDGIPHTSFF